MPTGHIDPAATVASVSDCHPRHSTSTPPARTASSTPQERISSIERRLTTVARGSEDSSARRSTSIVSTPSRASEMAAASPAGPAPATTTGSVVGVHGLSHFVGHSVFHRDIMSSEYAVTMATRRYEQRLRAQTAEETRRRVLDAVYDAAARGARPAGQRRPDRAHRRRRAIDRLRDLRLARRALRRVRRRPARARRLPPRARRRRRSRPARDICATGSPAACTPSPPTATSSAPSSRWRRSTRTPSAAPCSAASSDERRG